MADGKARKMWALPGADLTVPRSLLMHGADNSPVTVPCPSYLVEHPKGLVLFDTGCNPRIIDDVVGYWGDLGRSLGVSYARDRTVDSQIRALGFKLEEVKYVVISHLHLDQTGGMYMEPKAQIPNISTELR